MCLINLVLFLLWFMKFEKTSGLLTEIPIACWFFSYLNTDFITLTFVELTCFRLSWFPLFFLIIQPQGLSCGFFVIQLGISLTLFSSRFWSPPNANVTSAFKGGKISEGVFNLAKFEKKMDQCSRQLIALDVSNFEYQIFVFVFYRQVQWKKSKQIFKIQNIEIDELPRTQIISSTGFSLGWNV